MFIRYISHELRNPLNVVALGLDVMKNIIENNNKSGKGKARGMPDDDLQYLNQELQHVLEDITSSSRKATEILDALLSVESSDLGITQLERTQIPLSAILSESLAKFHSQVSNFGSCNNILTIKIKCIIITYLFLLGVDIWS